MKKTLSFSLIALALGLTACTTKTYQSTLTEGVDNSVSPQQDFYRYVNGKWVDTAQIPSDRTSWGTLAELNELNEKRSVELLQAVISNPNFANDEKAQRLKALYQSYTDLTAREKLGLSPIQADLSRIERIKTFAELEQYLINETKQGNEMLFGWSVFAHLKNSRQNAIYFSNDSLGLSNDYYQKDTPENRKTLQLYQDYVAQMLHFAQVKNPKQKAKAIVEYEKAIAKTLFTNEQRRDIQKRYNPLSINELAKASKHINLANYLKAVGVNTEEVIVWEPNFLKQFDQLINPQNLALIKDYLRFKTISNASTYLNKALDDANFAFYGKQLVGQKQQRPLDKRALRLINNQIGQEFAQFYVEKFFPATAKRDLLEMAGYLVKAYHQRIDNLSWMSAETKAKAKVKLDKFIVEVGYPNKWKDYSQLHLKTVEQGGSLYANLREIAKWNYQEALSKIGKPVDLNEWGMLPQVVNASYSPLMNRIVFPAGILQAPLYDMNADPAVNFGAIGAIIGHEITHGFDDSGSKFDGDGNLKEWWTAEDRQKFEALADQLVAQFDKFEVAPKIFVNGRFTLGENIADLGGLSIAYDALKRYERDHGVTPILENFTPDQRFFMSWTRSWRNKATVQALTHQVKSDPHAPGQYRAFAPVLNISGFHNAFNTKQGDAMYRPINERIRIW
ncbi:M13 family metallopeptidase [Glaesserella parasuis]|uniref:M13 family metallopeptidase n=1 Tax=Glaesserella parasuis TaxID=738 RepID=UPI00243710E5|nr:M13 family metallopeptidase [Glaesserella parasuis]MDG6333551.1 M13 family metallopeptidase [Glaesserella parasuis]